MPCPPIHHPGAIDAAWAQINAPDTPDDVLRIACQFVADTARDARRDTARDILALLHEEPADV